MKLSVIIVNYNVKYFLEQALISVRNASKGLAVEVFVVDNDSADDSVAMVQDKFPEVHLLANEKNVGFSVANNQAIRLARGEYVLLLNPDTIVEENTFSNCIDFMDKRPDVGALGVKMIDGSGQFLPESKRGLPSPFVAFSKMFGLSKLFPKSKIFNHYHLGYLDKNETNEVEVLAGAFMFIRKSVLDEIGLLDETFFMYGEDIDLSYRIVQAGYKNYYLANARIIHYKGESTKKGSLNYIRVFYNAMIIFAKKHFQGEKAWIYIVLLKLAIYFHATITLLSNWIRKLYLPFLDAVIIFLGLIFLKDFWASFHFQNPNYYNHTIYLNICLYTGVWTSTIAIIGGYQDRGNLRRLFSSILLGSILIAAIYGFLEMPYRSSRALIVLGTMWCLLGTTLIRYFDHFLKFKNFSLGKRDHPPLIIVGSLAESARVKTLLNEAQVQKNIVGSVAPEGIAPSRPYLNSIEKLAEIVRIYKIKEIIFCSKDVSAQSIMSWMSSLGPYIQYKIIPEESLSIIGSSSKNTMGELYTIEIAFKIDQPLQRRQKRIVDVLFSIFSILTSPIIILLTKNDLRLVQNALMVLKGKYSWVGYSLTQTSIKLPILKPGILSPKDELDMENLSAETIERLDFVYAKNYSISKDWQIFWKAYNNWSS